MNVLAIGGAGFIGAAVVDGLLPLSATVTVFDLKRPPRDDIRYVRGSIADRSALAAAMEHQDVVLHFAAALGVAACQKDVASVLRTNVDGTRNVLELAARQRVTRLLFASSSEIYGDGTSPVFSESDTPTPKTPYGHSKLAGEALVREFATEHGIVSTVVRFFNVYGPRQRRDFVVSRFCKNALDGTDIEVHGDGQQTRTFTFIDDAALGAIGALVTPHATGDPFDIYNVASRETVSIRQLAERAIAVAHSPSRIIHRDYGEAIGRQPSLEIRHRAGDFGKLAAATDYSPRISLDEGLRRTLHSYAVAGSHAHSATALNALAPDTTVVATGY